MSGLRKLKGDDDVIHVIVSFVLTFCTVYHVSLIWSTLSHSICLFVLMSCLFSYLPIFLIECSLLLCLFANNKTRFSILHAVPFYRDHLQMWNWNHLQMWSWNRFQVWSWNHLQTWSWNHILEMSVTLPLNLRRSRMLSAEQALYTNSNATKLLWSSRTNDRRTGLPTANRMASVSSWTPASCDRPPVD